MDFHLCQDKQPSLFIEKKLQDQALSSSHPFTMLSDLKQVEQSVQHHPEGSVWKHTMLVVDRAAERRHLSQDPRILMWAALLHDLGKFPATKIRKGRITAYDHDKMGEGLAAEFLSEFTEDKKFIERVAKMVKWHMQMLFVVKGWSFADLPHMVKEVPIHEIALLSLADRLGRGGMDEQAIQEEFENLEHFLKKCNQQLEKELERV